MGRMKELLLKQEEDEWLTEEQEKWLNDIFRTQGIVYGDLIDIDMITGSNFKRIHIDLVDGNQYTFEKEDIIEINALCIKFHKELKYLNTIRITVIPFDKVSKVTYEYEMDV